MQVVIDSLRPFLQQTRKKNWARLLRLAVWPANDIPGPVHGYSPHFHLFGRHPIGFGDCLPVMPEHGSQDAVTSFADMITNRQYLPRQLQRIHDAQAKRFLAEPPTHMYHQGKYVWYRGHNKAKKLKLHRLWTGPGMMMQCMGRNQYRVKTERDQEVVLDSMRVKPYISIRGEQD